VEEEELYLVQVGQLKENNVAVCKIMERKVLILQRLEKAKQDKEKAKQARASAPKEIEVNWGVSENDLMSKLRHMEEFLAKGKKVVIMVASKRKSKKASPDEAQKVLDTIRAKAKEIDAKESKPMEGKLLGEVTLHIEKKVQSK